MKDLIIDLLEKNHTKKEISNILNIGYSTVIKHSKGLSSTPLARQCLCSDCGETDPKLFYGKMKNRCKGCHNSLGYKLQQEKIISYAKSRGPIECSICSYDRLFAALEWHHRDPTKKDPSWNRGWNYDKLKAELDKCDLVCANCHREIHHSVRWPPQHDSNVRPQD